MTSIDVRRISWLGGIVDPGDVQGGWPSHRWNAYGRVVTVDLMAMDRVLEIDHTSRAARIQAGALSPAVGGTITRVALGRAGSVSP